jgi:hypothetical protein
VQEKYDNLAYYENIHILKEFTDKCTALPPIYNNTLLMEPTVFIGLSLSVYVYIQINISDLIRKEQIIMNNSMQYLMVYS